MRGVILGRMFGVLAFCATSAMAQDVTLTSRDGSLSVQGILRIYDGETYRITSDYGPLTIDATAVLCDGPACPDLNAPKAVIRLVGDREVAAALLPPLLAQFATAKGLSLSVDDRGITLLQSGKNTIAEVSFTPMPPEAARAAMLDARAEMVVARFAGKQTAARVFALDALVPIVAPDNLTPNISTTNLAKALVGEINNWKDIGGPDRPMVIHGLQADSDLAAALAARLGKAMAVAVTHPDLTSLAVAVARDPWALGVTGQALAGKARVLSLTDSCGFALQATSLAVKAEDYPLTLPVYLLTPPRRLPLIARELLEFLVMPKAQQAISDAGYVARNLERTPLARDGVRLMNAINAAGDEVTLADVQRLSKAMAGADRLSLTFRFEDGSDNLDVVSKENLNDLAKAMQAGLFDRDLLTLIGFSDGTGAAAQNQTLAEGRARAVLSSLSALAPDLARLPNIDAFGEAMPMACDETAAGRRLNRRVEIWLRPNLAGDQSPN
jgi:phosphate transport system substrate-binding protein